MELAWQHLRPPPARGARGPEAPLTGIGDAGRDGLGAAPALLPALCGTLLLWIPDATAGDASPPPRYAVEVAAGDLDRTQSVVRFPLPAPAGPGERWVLRDAAGEDVPLQADFDGEARFLLEELAAGARARFLLERVRRSPAPEERVRTERCGGKLAVSLGERRLLEFAMVPADPPDGLDPAYRRAGFIHPVFTPSGTAVTDAFAPDNPHQYGIWFAWPHVESEGRSLNFWDALPTDNPAQHSAAGTGWVRLAGLERFWSGPVHGGFRAHLQHADRSADPERAAILETWTVRAYAAGEGDTPFSLIELESRQRPVGEAALRFPQIRYGGFSIRGRREWRGPGGALQVLTCEGETDRLRAHASRARWCWMGGELDGGVAGLAVLAYPGNFRFPEPLRVHEEIPFLNFAPSQAGEWVLAPDSTRVWRYRIVAADGPPDGELLERLWRDFAEPARVDLEPLRP